MTTLDFSSVLGFTKWMHLLGSVPNNTNRTRENIGTGDNSTTIFFISNTGIISSTYILTCGTSEASLTTLVETTDYTIDLDTSRITLTAAGVTKVGTKNIYAEYKYNVLQFLDSDINNALASAELRIKQSTNMTFANYTDTDPGYRQVNDEIYTFRSNYKDVALSMFWYPLVELNTTVATSYTTGGTSLVLTDASGFPNAATIYIGGNKVTYTAKSTNTLTVPSTTPSISAGAEVRSEVLELSKQAEAEDPAYYVLTPDIDYKIDYLEGTIKMLNNVFWSEYNYSDLRYIYSYGLKATYMHAWHEKSSSPNIPVEIEELTYMISAKRLGQRMLASAHAKGFNGIDPNQLNVSENDINDILENYRTFNVGTSMYNKGNLS